MFIDTHTHFDMCLEDKSVAEQEMLSNLKENDIGFAVQISTEVEAFEWSYNFAKRNSNIFFTIGIHPSSKAGEKELATMSAFVQSVMDSGDRKILFGIGEIGLDYYRMRVPKAIQIASFEYQLDVAEKHKLPVIIHSRDAKDETLGILKTKKPGAGIMHCFSGDSRDMKEFLDLGFYISFAGNLTYKNAANLRDAAMHVPLDRLLLETDAPFLSPVPMRGKNNLPEYVMHTYNFFSDLRKMDTESVKEKIYENFNKLNEGRL